MGKGGYIFVGVLVASGVGYYLYHKINRDKFKKNCLEGGGSLIGQWQCDNSKT